MSRYSRGHYRDIARLLQRRLIPDRWSAVDVVVDDFDELFAFDNPRGYDTDDFYRRVYGGRHRGARDEEGS